MGKFFGATHIAGKDSIGALQRLSLLSSGEASGPDLAHACHGDAPTVASGSTWCGDHKATAAFSQLGMAICSTLHKRRDEGDGLRGEEVLGPTGA